MSQSIEIEVVSSAPLLIQRSIDQAPALQAQAAAPLDRPSEPARTPVCADNRAVGSLRSAAQGRSYRPYAPSDPDRCSTCGTATAFRQAARDLV